MIASAFIGLIGGLLLGGRFKVAALVALLPATALLMLALASAGRISFGMAFVDFLGMAMGLQFGYIARMIVSLRRRPHEPAGSLRTTA